MRIKVAAQPEVSADVDTLPGGLDAPTVLIRRIDNGSPVGPAVMGVTAVPICVS